MDDYRSRMFEAIGPGGFRCPCCAGKYEKRKRKGGIKLNQVARRSLKRELRDESA